MRTKVGIGFVPRETLITCAPRSGAPGFARHEPRCDRKHGPASPSAATGDVPDCLPPFYCIGRGDSVWARRRGGERDAAHVIAAVRAVVELAG